MYVDRHEIKSLEEANNIAFDMSERTGVKHIGIDNGGHVWPRYDVIVPPKVGDPVSYGFNGDYYPCGHVASISQGKVPYRVITTDTGEVFYRKRNTSGSWVMKGGTWSLVAGHINERNPSF